MADNTYITALIESLEKKVGILKEIHAKDEEQIALINCGEFSFDKFDITAEEKSVLIYKLERLDDGFEMTYKLVKEELDKNRTAHAIEIKRMQELITEITDWSAKIQAEEARNKAALERVFKRERESIRMRRSSVKAVNSYSQAMAIGKNIKNNF